MEITAKIQDGKALSVSILIENLDVTKLSQLTERDIKETVRPLIENYFRIEQKCKDAENISRFLCYGENMPQSPCEEDRCSRQDLGNCGVVPSPQ